MIAIGRASLLLGLVGLVGAGCLGPLDIFGNPTVVSEDEDFLKENQLEDDRIEDKHPIYDPELVVEEVFGQCTMRLNKSGSVTKLDVIPFDEDDAELQDRLFSTRAYAASALGADADLIPSMEVVNGKLKPFNDGLYAAIEGDLQEGVSGLFSKREWLYDLLDALTARPPGASTAQSALLDQARALVAAGLLAGDNPVEVPTAVRSVALAAVAEFEADAARARPVGFYSWSSLLGEVFAQDRFLQNLDSGSFGFDTFAAIAVVLDDEPELLARYQTIHALYAGLTNPYASYSPLEILPYVDGLASLDDVDAVRSVFEAEHSALMTCARAAYALFPASRSKDTEYFNSRWCATGVPAGTSLIDELISAIRDGAVDLAPAPDAGWYDYQMWALETLLLPERGPESDHLLLTAAYKQKLLDTFKSIITQNRETHVKGLAGFGPVSAPLEPVDIYPLFAVEPFPTFYLRTARGYRFLATYLEAVLGSGYLDAAGRLYEDGGRDPVVLAGELQGKIALLYGLYVLSANSVGLDPRAYLLEDETAEVDLDDAATVAREWLRGWRSDADVLVDPRVIVQVATDDGSGRGVYWAILGIKAIRIRAEFVEGFLPEVLSASACPLGEIVPRDYHLLVEAMEEVRFAGGPPTRDEFRALCDRHDNAADIVADLEDGL